MLLTFYTWLIILKVECMQILCIFPTELHGLIVDHLCLTKPENVTHKLIFPAKVDQVPI